MTKQSLEAHEIGRKQFSMHDQLRFAALSLDRNPMHVDSVAARRLLTGRPVVHGIHVVIIALEQWRNDRSVAPSALDCTFGNPVNVDDTVVYSQKNDADGRVVIEARVDDLLCAKLRITTGAPAPATGRSIAGPPAGDRQFARLSEPIDLAPTDHLHKRYLLPVERAELSGGFPRVCRLLGQERTAGLLALSYFVGMVCPGLHSIFSTLSLRLDQPRSDPESITFTVDQYDDRFRRFHVSFEGVLAGSLTAFVRPPPQPQLTMRSIAEHVVAGEFNGSRSLVIGASRGLGEMAAKLLAAGGGHVVLGYANGLDDIEKVHAEISAAGAGKSEIQHLDVTSPSYGTVDFRAIDAVYYFATPRIYRKKAELFVQALFDEFIGYYATALLALCRHIESLRLPAPIRIYVPSSVFIAQRPDGLVEYAMAKAAAEVLIDDINRNIKAVSILATRLPKLSTDQTSSVLKAETGDNLAALLPIVRLMNEVR